MSKNIVRTIGAVIVTVALVFGLSACTSSAYQERKTQNEQTRVQGESQEQKNLKEKISRDEASAEKIGYVYIMSFGKFIGYYTIMGKISSNGSQLAPEQDVLCPTSSQGCGTVDEAQDDNTYGEGDPGVFFFTTEGAMVVTNLDYLYADQPIAAAIDVPKLNASK